MTGNCSLAWKEYATFDLFWKGGPSPSLRTINHWWEHWHVFLIHGQRASAGTWPTWPNSRRTSSTWLASTTWRRMLCRGLRYPRSQRFHHWWTWSEICVALLPASPRATAGCRLGHPPPCRYKLARSRGSACCETALLDVGGLWFLRRTGFCLQVHSRRGTSWYTSHAEDDCRTFCLARHAG